MSGFTDRLAVCTMSMTDDTARVVPDTMLPAREPFLWLTSAMSHLILQTSGGHCWPPLLLSVYAFFSFLSIIWVNSFMNSMGSGKTMVEFFSTAISVKVCR